MRAVIIMGLGDGLPMEPPMARIMGQINLPPRALPRYIHDKNALSRFSYNHPGYIYKPLLLGIYTINSEGLFLVLVYQYCIDGSV